MVNLVLAKMKHLFHQSSKYWVILLLAIPLVAFLYINPRGNFSLNDDWFYALAVKNFHFINFHLDPLITPSLIGQIFYAKIVTLIFGFSLQTLRYSTIFLSIAGAICLFFIFLELGLSRTKAFWLSLAVFFNPLYFYLSFTFLTDLPAMVFALFSLYFLIKFSKTQRPLFFIIFSILIIYASCIRQNYFFLLPLAAIFIKKDSPNYRKLLAYYFSSLLVLAAVVIVFQYLKWWPTQAIGLHTFEDFSTHVQYLASQSYSLLQYLGFFALPLIFWQFPGLSRREKIIKFSLIVATAVWAIIMYFNSHLLFPSFRNVISIAGFGPSDPDLVLSGTPPTLLGFNMQIFLTVAAVFGTGYLLFFFYKLFKKYYHFASWEKRLIFFLTLASLSQVAIIMSFLSFDRYYLPIFVFSLISLALLFRDAKFSKINIIILVFLAISVLVLAKVYLNENRMKWQIADSLRGIGAQVYTIDAGYEWLGWNWFRQPPDIYPAYWAKGIPWYIGQLFPDNNRRYVISYDADLPNYRLLGSFPYDKFFGKELKLYLQKKIIE